MRDERVKAVSRRPAPKDWGDERVEADEEAFAAKGDPRKRLELLSERPAMELERTGWGRRRQKRSCLNGHAMIKSISRGTRQGCAGKWRRGGGEARSAGDQGKHGE